MGFRFDQDNCISCGEVGDVFLVPCTDCFCRSCFAFSWLKRVATEENGRRLQGYCLCGKKIVEICRGQKPTHDYIKSVLMTFNSNETVSKRSWFALDKAEFLPVIPGTSCETILFELALRFAEPTHPCWQLGRVSVQNNSPAYYRDDEARETERRRGKALAAIAKRIRTASALQSSDNNSTDDDQEETDEEVYSSVTDSSVTDSSTDPSTDDDSSDGEDEDEEEENDGSSNESSTMSDESASTATVSSETAAELLKVDDWSSPVVEHHCVRLNGFL